MTTNAIQCSGKAKFLLEIHSPEQATQFIMKLLPDTAGNAAAGYFRASTQQALNVIISAFHLLDTPYTSKDISDVLLYEEKLFELKERLEVYRAGTPEYQDFENLMKRYATAEGFNMEKFKVTLGGLAGRLKNWSQQTA